MEKQSAQEGFREKTAFLPKAYLLFLTVMLPLKFASTVGVPEMPMIYWTEFAGVLLGSWPVLLFPAAAVFGLALCLFCLPRGTFRNPFLRIYALLWALLALASLPGWIHATTWDFAAHNVIHCFGLAAYAASVCLVLEQDSSFQKKLFFAILAGGGLSVYSALNQYFSGFEETRRFIAEKEQATGQKIMTGQFATRLMESRVSGDFAVCNVYAGYLTLLFPLILAWLYNLGSRVTPPRTARLILCIPAGLLFLFLLKETGSRGGLLGLIAGIGVVILAFRLPRKLKLFFYTLIPVLVAAFIVMVKTGRGFKSMYFRFDYFKAAFEMMLDHPFAGAGWGEFFHDYLIYKDLINDEAPHGPHNFILALGSQAGVGAFLISGILLLIPVVAAVILLRRASAEKDTDNTAMKCGMTLAVSAWTFHSLLELNYETPGSTATAIALSSLILCSGEFAASAAGWTEKPPLRILCFRLFPLICIGLILYPCFTMPKILSGEMQYERIHSATDLRFGTNKEKLPPSPDEVMRLLKNCKEAVPESPFPYDAASAYFTTLGPAYFPDALFLLEEAIRRAPKRSAYYYRKYRILELMPGRRTEAEQALKKAQELSPKNPKYFSAPPEGQ